MIRENDFFGRLTAANRIHFVLISVNSCIAHMEWSIGSISFGMRAIISWNNLVLVMELSSYDPQFDRINQNEFFLQEFKLTHIERVVV